MLLLRREYHDAAEHPEIVFLHAEVATDGENQAFPYKATRVVAPTEDPGLRVAHISIPEPPEGGHVLVRYRFSSVCRGKEWDSPVYEVKVPSDELTRDLCRIPEEEGGNLVPAAGRGYFRFALPVEDGERASGTIRYGFGAMRKKPSPLLCRAAVEVGDGLPPVIEIPETLSVLKNSPMPYFFYHTSGDEELRRDKIACARITLLDEPGEIISARLIWSDPSWRAVNVSPMEAKGMVEGELSAANEYFAQDLELARVERFAALSRLPVPRTFEARVFGPSGSRVEYCYQVVVRLPSGESETRWRNREEGGNWSVLL
ncbi:MAG: hypothetical protein FWF95_03750 [Syntrophorhabdaceae bacterium]|nr:hypothetical protein [Syntrophorhabdaceae bacterium]